MQPPPSPAKTEPSAPEEGGGETSWLRDIILTPPQDANPFPLGARALFVLVLSAFSLKYTYAIVVHGMVENSFLHLVNLPFHEFGHIIFRLLGEFMMILGGSLFQLLMPLVCLGTFLIKTGDSFAAAVAWWWFGQNFIDLAPYIGDARAMELTLLGGQTGQDNPDMHDWNNILGTLHMLDYDHILAGLANYTGLLIMLMACIWAGYLLVQIYRYQRTRANSF